MGTYQQLIPVSPVTIQHRRLELSVLGEEDLLWYAWELVPAVKSIEFIRDAQMVRYLNHGRCLAKGSTQSRDSPSSYPSMGAWEAIHGRVYDLLSLV